MKITNRKTKIIAKIADNRCEKEFLKTLLDTGADVFWLNTAHQEVPDTKMVVDRIREVSTKVPILLDTKGPEIRTKNIENEIVVNTGDTVILTGDLSRVGHNIINVSYPNFENEVPEGSIILYDDASIELSVLEKTKDGLSCLVKNSGKIKNKKSLNVPDVHISLPALTEKDERFINFCAKENIDYVIHSFVRNKEDIFEIRKILSQYPDYKGGIIAKIENREGFLNVEEILDNCDGLMVARGDLGAEVPLYEMTYMQKKMIEACLRKGKIGIVATQVLDSMIKNPRPTRAEVTDTANAVLDGATGVSMSGETAYGDYPKEAVEVMSKIMEYTEERIGELVHFKEAPTLDTDEYRKAKEVLDFCQKQNVDLIIIQNENLEFIKALSAFRKKQLIVPVLSDEMSIRLLALNYGVRAVSRIEEIEELKNKSKTVLVKGNMSFEVI